MRARVGRHVVSLGLVSAVAFAVGGARPDRGEDTAAARSHAALIAAAVGDVEHRLSALEGEADALESTLETEVLPLARALSARGAGRQLALRVATALVREGRTAGIAPRLLLGVLLVEDPRLDTAAVSPRGATGLMQVMTFHTGRWPCDGDDLRDPEVNICYGARILAEHVRLARGNLDVALLGYNGCVRGAFTPDCDLYPLHVYRHATLGWLEDDTGLTRFRRLFRPVE